METPTAMSEYDDELSDLDDDVIEDDTPVDWFEEEDEAEQPKPAKEEKEEITDPFFLEHLDVYLALCDIEDLNFTTLDYPKQVELINSLLPVTDYLPGQEIFKEDDEDASDLFIIIATERTAKTAEVEVLRKSEDGDKGPKLLRLHRGHFFGHKFFLTKQIVPRDSTVRVPIDSPCSVAIASLKPEHFEKWSSFRNTLLVRTVPLMQLLPRQDRQEIIGHMTIRSFRNEHIIRQGDRGDEFFIIIEGAADVVEEKVQPDGEMQSTKLVTLREGHFFGEMSLIFDEPRVASVIAMGTVVCLCLVKSVFRAALSAEIFSEVMQEVLEKRTKMRQQRKAANEDNPRKDMVRRNSEPEIETPESDVTVTSTLTLRKVGEGRVVNKYQILGDLGKGSYADVYLCQDENTSIRYAMKVMARPAKNLQDEIEEIAIMKKIKHPNIVGLHEVIDDPSSRKIYVVQEFVAGGALMPDVEECDPFPSELARKYFRDVLKGVHYLHSKGIVHRDIKPQNLLLAADGTVKLADFGASVLTIERNEKVVAGGTPAFMAPELFQVAGANPSGVDLNAADIWSLGITLYFMVVGKAPWKVTNEIELAHTVNNFELVFSDESLDPHLKHLVRQMLDRDAKSRIKLEAILEDEWITQEGSDPLLTEEELRNDVKRPNIANVLVVDDSTLACNIISHKLDSANCSYVVCNSGKEAVALLRKDGLGAFGLILVDYYMPEKNGAETAAEIRALGYKGHLIGVSGDNLEKDSDGVKDEFVAAGADDFWVKPIKSVDVMALFRSDTQGSVPAGHAPVSTVRRENSGINAEDVSAAIATVDKVSLNEQSTDSIKGLEAEAADVVGELRSLKKSPFTASKRNPMESSFIMTTNDFMNNCALPRLNSIDTFRQGSLARTSSNISNNSSGSSNGGRTLSRTKDFILIPSDIVLIPSEDRATVEKSIAYTGIEGASTNTTFRKDELASRKKKREAAMKKSKLRANAKTSGSRRRSRDDNDVLEDSDQEFGVTRKQSVERMESHKTRQYSSNELKSMTGFTSLAVANLSNKDMRSPKTHQEIPSLNVQEDEEDDSEDEYGEEEHEEEEHEEEEEDNSEEEEYDCDDLVQLDGGADFEKVMDEIGTKKKNLNDLLWNSISSQELPPLVAPNEQSNSALKIRFGSYDSIGIRPYMEDRHFCTNDLVNTCVTAVGTNTVGSVEFFDVAYFGVYDGHSGYSVAEYLQRNLHKAFYDVLHASQRSLPSNQPLKQPSSLSSSGSSPTSDPKMFLSKCFHDSCISVDREIIEIDFKRQKQGLHSGTLASEVFGGSVAVMMALVRDKRLPPSSPLTCVVAHVGDCRAVLSNKGVAVKLTEDHKPMQPREKERIERSGGWVQKDRVNGLLAVSRSFGDINYKAVDDTIFKSTGLPTLKDALKTEAECSAHAVDPGLWHIQSASDMHAWARSQQVIGLPETREFAVESSHEFVILASDGVWDVFTPQEAVNFVRWVLRENGGDVAIAAKRLIEEAESRDTNDNVTVVVCALNQTV